MALMKGSTREDPIEMSSSPKKEIESRFKVQASGEATSKESETETSLVRMRPFLVKRLTCNLIY